MVGDGVRAAPEPSAVALLPRDIGSMAGGPLDPGLDCVVGFRLSVWQVHTSRVSDAEIAVGSQWLDEVERQRVSTFARADLARAYAVAHAAARRIVGAVVGQEPATVAWGRHPCPACGGGHGRLRVMDSQIEVSLSHTDGRALIAVSDVPVGVDIERRVESPLAVVGLMHPDEVAEVAMAGPAADVWFTRMWARKEAYLKGLGIGLGRGLHLDHVGGDPAPGRRVGAWVLRDLDVGADHAASVVFLPLA